MKRIPQFFYNYFRLHVFFLHILPTCIIFNTFLYTLPISDFLKKIFLDVFFPCLTTMMIADIKRSLFAVIMNPIISFQSLFYLTLECKNNNLVKYPLQDTINEHKEFLYYYLLCTSFYHSIVCIKCYNIKRSIFCFLHDVYIFLHYSLYPLLY